MSLVLVDTNVLVDVLTGDPEWGEWSSEMLARCFDEGRVGINPIIYAEVSVAYDRLEDLDQALSPSSFQRLDLPWEAAFLAGKAFRAYRRRGGARRTPLPDFYIGAHAAVAGLPLLTRDTARYATYFPRVKVIGP